MSKQTKTTFIFFFLYKFSIIIHYTMGVCCSRPLQSSPSTASSVADEHTGLLSNSQPYEPHPHSHLTTEQQAQQREEDRLRHLEQTTMDALIAQRQSVGDFPHHLEPFGQHPGGKDYTEVLRRFNQQIKLPMVSIASKSQNGAVGVLAGGKVEKRWMEMVGWAGEQAMGVVEGEFMDIPKDELVVRL